MINPFQVGDTKEFTRTVMEEDTAIFDSGLVHPVYATFALARDAEWACRLFVLEMKEDHEEGIGTMITVDHVAPAVLGDEVRFTASVKSVERNELICTYNAYVGERLIAQGEQGQKIISKDKIEHLFSRLRS